LQPALLLGGQPPFPRQTRRDLQLRFRHAADTEPAIPGIAELLADPAFDPLRQWLKLRGVDAADLQADVDQLLEQARQMAAAWI
jgi:hypothetical protein